MKNDILFTVMTDAAVIRGIKLPAGVEGFTTPGSDDLCNIYVNAQLTREHQRRVIAHELSHAKRNHFSGEHPIAEIERDAGRRKHAKIEI